jgi:hypothetical protein
VLASLTSEFKQRWFLANEERFMYMSKSDYTLLVNHIDVYLELFQAMSDLPIDEFINKMAAKIGLRKAMRILSYGYNTGCLRHRCVFRMKKTKM